MVFLQKKGTSDLKTVSRERGSDPPCGRKTRNFLDSSLGSLAMSATLVTNFANGRPNTRKYPCDIIPLLCYMESFTSNIRVFGFQSPCVTNPRDVDTVHTVSI